MDEAWDWQKTLQAYDNAKYYGPLLDAHGDLMSQTLQEGVARGRATTEAAYRHAIAQRGKVIAELDTYYASYDAILCLSSASPAPKGHEWTGDPVFNAMWTYSGVPCVNLPLLEVDGLPMGVTLNGPRGGDGPLMRTARWLERHVSG